MMDTAKERLMNADMAFANRQYKEALSWYMKVLELEPDHVYALSRAGALCVSMSKFQEALTYFGRARELDPKNGDNAFNYGNACFFNKDNVKAFEQYVEADRLGCSDDVKPRLYYQMAALCSMRQDIPSAMAYIQKCEESDKTGATALSQELISEKLKLYMLQQDYAKAETCAAQLVAAAPTSFKNYMVYFSILMAHKSLDTAETLLDEAERYAELSPEDRFTLTLQKAALYMAEDKAEDAVRVLEECRKTGGLTGEQLSQLILALAEAYSKEGTYDRSIQLLQELLSGHGHVSADPVQEPVAELTPEELEEMIRRDMEAIQEKIDTGEIDGDMGAYALQDYDENGNVIHYYEDAGLTAAPAAEKPVPAPQVPEIYELTRDLREKATFMLLSCYLAKDDFAAAQKLAGLLKHSSNKYYNYFGIYTAALTERKLKGDTDTTRQTYAETIAYFRNKCFSDTTDSLAAIFRARLYAELGKYEKATELACLLADEDRQKVLEYIESCKQ